MLCPSTARGVQQEGTKMQLSSSGHSAEDLVQCLIAQVREPFSLGSRAHGRKGYGNQGVRVGKR